ncbi:unnamed protein product [Rhizophagus irregularis]|nr:unnamed protein product [Rhizophagus irregularis]
MQNNENIDEWINWIEESINKKHIKYYEFENFKNIQEIGSEIINEIELQRNLDFHNNIIRFYGITKHESNTENILNPTKDYLLVMEYADSGIVHRDLHSCRREIIVPNTPNDYSNLYTECWNNEPI